MRLDFWKNNQTDQHYQLSSEDLADQFAAWVLKQDNHEALRQYYLGSQLLIHFIGSGLGSAWAHDNPAQVEEIHTIAYETLWGDSGLFSEAS